MVSVKEILNRSTSATCGVFEREVILKNKNVSVAKVMLRKKGFNIIGTSEPNGQTRKVWFIRSGANL